MTLNETKKGHSIPGFAVAHPMILRRSRLRGLPWYGWHGFRRDIASNLYELGANEKIVQRVLRHAKPHIAKTATLRPLIRRCWRRCSVCRRRWMAWDSNDQQLASSRINGHVVNYWVDVAERWPSG